MPLNDKELRELEDRFEQLENKLKTTFTEVEKRLDLLKVQPVDIMDRIQELEDLILLMQLEITKLKDRVSISTDFLTPDSPGMMERLNRIEEAVSIKESDKDVPEEGESLFHPQADENSPQIIQKENSLLKEVQKILAR